MSVRLPAPLVALVGTLALLAACPPAPAEAPKAGRDANGDPLPAGALARLGTIRFRIDGTTYGAALSPDGKTMASVYNGNAVRIVDIATGKEVRQITTNFAGLQSLRYSPDGKKLIGATYNNIIFAWDPATGNELRRIEAGQRQTQNLVVSGNGQFVAAGQAFFGGNQKATIHAWNVATGKAYGPFQPLPNQNVQAALSADGKALATWGQHWGGMPNNDPEKNPARIVQLWDVTTAKEKRQIKIDDTFPQVHAAAFSPDGKHLAVCHGTGSLTVWDLTTGKQLYLLATRQNSGFPLQYSPDGKMLVAGTREGVIQLWDAVGGKRLGVCEGPRCYNPSVVFAPKGKVLACGVWGQAVKVWEVPGGKVLSPTGGHEYAVSSVRFSADGKRVLTVDREQVCVWDPAAGKELRHHQMLADRVAGGFAGFRLSPDGKYLLGARYQGFVLWEAETGKEVCSLPGQNNNFGNGEVAGVFSPDGNHVLTDSVLMAQNAWHHTVHVWDVNTGRGRVLARVKAEQGTVQTFAFSPDSKRVAVARTRQWAGPNPAPNELSLLDFPGGKAVWKGTAPAAWVRSMTFSPDGKTLALTTMGQAVHLHDAATGKEVRQLFAPGSSPTSRCVFSPDGRTLALGVRDGTGKNKVVLWEVLTGAVRGELVGHRGPVNCLDFSPDGRGLVSGSADTTALVWDVAGRGGKAELAEKELAGLWEDLAAGDAGRAFQAVRKLASAPDASVPFLKKRMPPAGGKGNEADRIKRLVTQLDDDDFETREKASRELGKVGKGAKEELDRALADKPSAEKKRRIQALLEVIAKGDLSGDALRHSRALEVLELSGTRAAREHVEALAKGDPTARLTAEAKEALRRLTRRAEK